MTSKRDIRCCDLHTLEPSAVQAFLDTLSIVERHRLMRELNAVGKLWLHAGYPAESFERAFRNVITRPAQPDERTRNDRTR